MESMLDSGVTANLDAMIVPTLENMKWILQEVSPFIMLIAAIAISGIALSIIVNLFLPKKKDEDEVEYM